MKVDEHSVVAPVDAASRARLAAALDHPDVAAAMLIGSQARGSPAALSDVDVAVWLAPGRPSARRAELRLELLDHAARALGTGEIDIVLLDDAPPLLRHRALRDGVRLVDRDPRTRIRRETATIVEYLDTAPLRATLDAARRARLAEGRFWSTLRGSRSASGAWSTCWSASTALPRAERPSTWATRASAL